MKTALILTTINVPTVLALFRRFDPAASVRFFCVGDEKSPIVDTYNFCTNLSNTEWYPPERQKSLGYKCCELIPWSCIQRRNIAVLEALGWGADVIISIDDDNIPMDPNYFLQFQFLLDTYAKPFSGLQASSPSGWLDPGQFLTPPATQRGFPIDPASAGQATFTPVVDAEIGLAQGMILGDPDTSAVERIVRSPAVRRVDEVLKSGFVVDPKDTWTITNSQNTAFVRELAPAFFMLPGVGRYDDIYASLIMQRVMREKGYVTHFGRPFAYQERNKHDLVKDLRGEIDGMENVARLADWLDAHEFPCPQPTLDLVRHVFFCSNSESFWPTSTIEAALAFLDDLETVL
jgi:hypothetical protein